MIAVVQYGLGNVAAFLHIFRQLGVPAISASAPEEVLAADKLVLPGVGAFDWAMSCLERSGLRGALDRAVHCEKKDVLGVCVGAQMMLERSEEGDMDGLGWIRGEVRALSREKKSLLVPHMGWNEAFPRSQGAKLFGENSGDADGVPRFYFLHSFVMMPAEEESVFATTEYGGVNFACAIGHNNVLGTQFHPEKSHHWGVSLLSNFASC